MLQKDYISTKTVKWDFLTNKIHFFSREQYKEKSQKIYILLTRLHTFILKIQDKLRTFAVVINILYRKQLMYTRR